MRSSDLKLKANFYLDKSNIEIMFTEESRKSLGEQTVYFVF